MRSDVKGIGGGVSDPGDIALKYRVGGLSALQVKYAWVTGVRYNQQHRRCVIVTYVYTHTNLCCFMS